MVAAELTARMQLLASTIMTPAAGNRNATAHRARPLARTGRRVLLHLATKAPWAQLAADAMRRLRALAVPG